MIIQILVIAFALYISYRMISEGLVAMIARCAMGALAIATGVGFAGPLRQAIPLPQEHNYLFGVCFLAITLVAYLLQRGITSYYLLEREIVLPEYIDRFGGAIFGFLTGLMLGGFICLAALTFPLPNLGDSIKTQIVRSSSFAEGTVWIISTVAGKGDAFSKEEMTSLDDGYTIFLRNFLPKPDKSPETQEAS